MLFRSPSFLSIPEKTQLATSNLLPSPPSISSSQPPLNISFFSAASFPLAFPPTVALGFGWPRAGLGVEGVNVRVGRWLVGILADTNNNNGDVHDDGTLAREKGTNEGTRTRVRGWALMDFFTDPKDVDAGAGIVPLDRKSTRLNSSHSGESRMPSSA